MSGASLKALLVGAGGQLGQTLIAACPAGVELQALAHAELDASDAGAVQRVMARLKPDVILNAAAYTAVDKAESEVEAAEWGNVQAPRNLALAARDMGARMLHVSTDFVFDGAQSTPYKPGDVTAPWGVYGRTKLQGEQVVMEVLPSHSIIVRTAWLYAAQGRNFLRTMLRLMQERGAVRVVADQVGTPTSTRSLAEVLWLFAQCPELSGIYHWSDAGVASWYDFAVAIAEEAVACGVLHSMPDVTPIATHEFPTPVRRPAYSVLDKTATHAALGVRSIHWRQRLREVIKEIEKQK